MHNPANEILSMSDPQLDLAHDRVGNMTVLPDSLSCTYDAWNRLVKVSSGEMTIAEYVYPSFRTSGFHFLRISRTAARSAVDGRSKPQEVEDFAM